MKVRIGILCLAIGIFLQTSCESPPNASFKIKQDVSKMDSISQNMVERKSSQPKSLVIDSSKCIVLNFQGPCSWKVICPDYPQSYNAFKMMLYVDSNLAKSEETALQNACGTRVDTLAQGSIEMYAFSYWYGASHQDLFIYFRDKNQKFKRLQGFNPDNVARLMEILNTTSNGVHHFKVHEVYERIPYTLAFNGKSFDTTYIRNIPYKEFKRSGLKRYGAEKNILNGYFKFVHSNKDIDLNQALGFSMNFGFRGLLAAFCKKNEEYEFVGYFPSIPDTNAFETRNDFPVFKTKATGDGGSWEERLHYFDGKRYVGVLVPLNMVQYEALKKREYKMHPTYHLEYFTGEVY